MTHGGLVVGPMKGPQKKQEREKEMSPPPKRREEKERREGRKEKESDFGDFFFRSCMDHIWNNYPKYIIYWKVPYNLRGRTVVLKRNDVIWGGYPT